jgi:predicted DNA-binding transcriptional regulator YafY
MKTEDCIVVIDYTNYRGERRERRVHPSSITFSCTEFHPENQWLLTALDLEKNEMRVFAMKDVHSWRPDG